MLENRIYLEHKDSVFVRYFLMNTFFGFSNPFQIDAQQTDERSELESQSEHEYKLVKILTLSDCRHVIVPLLRFFVIRLR